MKILVGGRRCGKTSKLIKIAANEGKTIICADLGRKDNIIKQAKLMNLKIKEPMAVIEISRRKDDDRKGVLIDDFEKVIERLIERKVEYVTTSCRVRK